MSQWHLIKLCPPRQTRIRLLSSLETPHSPSQLLKEQQWSCSCFGPSSEALSSPFFLVLGVTPHLTEGAGEPHSSASCPSNPLLTSAKDPWLEEPGRRKATPRNPHMVPPENTTMCCWRVEFFKTILMGGLCSLLLCSWNSVLHVRVGLCTWSLSAARPHQPILTSSDSRISASEQFVSVRQTLRVRRQSTSTEKGSLHGPAGKGISTGPLSLTTLRELGTPARESWGHQPVPTATQTRDTGHKTHTGHKTPT